MPATGVNPDLARVYQDALDAGLDEEGARVAVAIATTEHGYAGGVGDLDRSALGSAGTFQFYFGGGMGDAYAAAHGMSKQEARDYLKANPHAANDWALSPSGYLGRAIRDGQAKGLHGADLATYAQRYGQRSESPERSGANYRTMSNETGGGDVASYGQADTAGDRPPSEFESSPTRAPSPGGLPGQSVYARVVAAKGDPISIRPAPGQETVETEQPETNFLGEPTGKTTRVKSANPNPVYRYTFADGTYVDAQATDAGQDISIRGGTALAATAKPPAGQQPTTVSTSANEQYIVTRMPDGSLKREPNPNYVAPTATAGARPTTVSTSASEPFIVTRQPDGSLKQEPNPNYVPPTAKGPAHQTHAVGGRLYVTDENGNVVNTTDLRSPEDKAKEQLALAQGQQNLTKGEIDIQAARQKLLPDAQQALQGLQDTVEYLRGMYEKGQIDMPQMNAYVQMAKDAAYAQLRGTTPAAEAIAKQRAKEADQKLGLDIVNQRLVSGAGLANTLMSAATGPHVMLRPGQQSLGVDPLEGLKALVDQLGGGQGVSDYGKSLLLGAQGAAPVGPQPAGL